MGGDQLSNYPQLCARVAASLAGRAVEVRFRDPYLAGVAGVAFRHNGAAVVDITPEYQGTRQLSVFLHELAHVRNDWAILREGIYHLAPASVDPQPGELQRLAAWEIEPPAVELADDWLQYSEANYWRYANPMPELQARLACLLEWRRDELNKVITNAVQAAIYKYRRIEK